MSLEGCRTNPDKMVGETGKSERNWHANVNLGINFRDVLLASDKRLTTDDPGSHVWPVP